MGLTPANTEGFAFIALDRNESLLDWLQPLASYNMSGVVIPTPIAGDLPFLVDTGITYMILWLDADDAPTLWQSGLALPAGVSINVSAPAADSGDAPALQYSFVTGEPGPPIAPTHVEWRIGNGLNTGVHALANDDYLYDATVGRIGFRTRPE